MMTLLVGIVHGLVAIPKRPFYTSWERDPKINFLQITTFKQTNKKKEKQRKIT